MHIVSVLKNLAASFELHESQCHKPEALMELSETLCT